MSRRSRRDAASGSWFAAESDRRESLSRPEGTSSHFRPPTRSTALACSCLSPTVVFQRHRQTRVRSIGTFGFEPGSVSWKPPGRTLPNQPFVPQVCWRCWIVVAVGGAGVWSSRSLALEIRTGGGSDGRNRRPVVVHQTRDGSRRTCQRSRTIHRAEDGDNFPDVSGLRFGGAGRFSLPPASSYYRTPNSGQSCAAALQSAAIGFLVGRKTAVSH